MCSNPKITRLAQLQSGPHYTASQQNTGRNTRPIKTKRESGDAGKDDFQKAGVRFTPGGTVNILPRNGTSASSADAVQDLCFPVFLWNFVHRSTKLSLTDAHLTPTLLHTHTHTVLACSLLTHGLWCGQGWVCAKGACLHKTFQRAPLKAQAVQGKCKYQRDAGIACSHRT